MLQCVTLLHQPSKLDLNGIPVLAPHRRHPSWWRADHPHFPSCLLRCLLTCYTRSSRTHVHWYVSNFSPIVHRSDTFTPQSRSNALRKLLVVYIIYLISVVVRYSAKSRGTERPYSQLRHTFPSWSRSALIVSFVLRHLVRRSLNWRLITGS